jgi:ferredoxin
MDPIPVIEIEDCIGCGACIDLCPDVFFLNESLEKAQVIHPEGCSREKIDEAIQICPVKCIHWDS